MARTSVFIRGVLLMRTLLHLTKLSIAIAIMASTAVTFANDNDEKKSDTRNSEKKLSRVWKTQSAVDGFQSAELFKAMACLLYTSPSPRDRG